MSKKIIQDKNEFFNLNEIVKSLFCTSAKLLIDFINAVFDEKFQYENAKAVLDKITFPKECFDGDRLNLDICIKISIEEKEYRYHIKIQTQNDSEIAKRMFDYGFQLAKENRVNEKLYFPKQLVLCIEEDESIESELTVLIVSNVGAETEYVIPLLNLWQSDIEELIQRNLYILLPFKLLAFQRELEKAKNIADILKKELNELRINREIDEEDFKKIVLVIKGMIEYFNRKYTNSSNLQNEGDKQ